MSIHKSQPHYMVLSGHASVGCDRSHRRWALDILQTESDHGRDAKYGSQWNCMIDFGAVLLRHSPTWPSVQSCILPSIKYLRLTRYI
eukprot:scaffold15231_cov66-Cyclotella_meneghiniana.AAC.17